LWKGEKPDEPADASWPSPWGRGRPGWHIECSAMGRRYLGDEFDIHGGGLDLVFPHHENEVAQSQAAGMGFARYWVHHALLKLGAAKMSKSTGNVIDMDSVLALGVRPIELRYYLAAPHYRSVIDFSEPALREAAAGFQRLEGFVTRAAEQADHGRPADSDGAGMVVDASGVAQLPAEFAAAMDDDLNTSRALAFVHDTVREGNALLATGADAAAPLASVRTMLGVLGLDPLDPAWTTEHTGRVEELRSTVDALVSLALEQRSLARERKDWAAADVVRDQLKQAGVVVEDTPNGPRWSVGDAR
jgi:cysteinyl-tRNA synthetase